MAHLLLFDDDNDIVEALGEILRGEGHDVPSASTGEEGLLVRRGAPLPDALVLDIDMPVSGGPEMVRKMLLHDAGRKNIPIILMSARHDLEHVARKMGTTYAIAKPPTLDLFLTLLDRLPSASDAHHQPPEAAPVATPAGPKTARRRCPSCAPRLANGRGDSPRDARGALRGVRARRGLAGG